MRKIWIVGALAVAGLVGNASAQVSVEEAQAKLAAKRAATTQPTEADLKAEVERLRAIIVKLNADNAELRKSYRGALKDLEQDVDLVKRAQAIIEKQTTAAAKGIGVGDSFDDVKAWAEGKGYKLVLVSALDNITTYEIDQPGARTVLLTFDGKNILRSFSR